MANAAHLALLKQGAEAWNRWRQEHPKVYPELRGADLRSADLQGANLSEVDLCGANLTEANLFRANLGYAHLLGADLTKVDLRGADLFGADLRVFSLKSADLSDARMGGTILNDLDMRQVKGLETVGHELASVINVQTISLSQGQIPDVFLRGVGVPEHFITGIRSLAGKPFEHYSCFISYSSKDKDFCQRLYHDLQTVGIPCWLDSEDLKTSDKLWEHIDASIRLYDKLLVILSKHAVESDWVEDEVTHALTKERQHPEYTVLFPIRLDNAVLETIEPWATTIRVRQRIHDFSHWKDHDAYQTAFTRLLRDLQQAEGTTAQPEEQ